MIRGKNLSIVPVLMLVLLLSSIVLSSFHNHSCGETNENCSVCRFYVSYSAVVVEPDVGIINYYQHEENNAAPKDNDSISDPCGILINSIHAPPKYLR